MKKVTAFAFVLSMIGMLPGLALAMPPECASVKTVTIVDGGHWFKDKSVIDLSDSKRLYFKRAWPLGHDTQYDLVVADEAYTRLRDDSLDWQHVCGGSRLQCANAATDVVQALIKYEQSNGSKWTSSEKLAVSCAIKFAAEFRDHWLDEYAKWMRSLEPVATASATASVTVGSAPSAPPAVIQPN